MLKQVNMLAAILPLVLASAAANAATFYNPAYDDNGPTSDCAASYYYDSNNHVNYYTNFSVPAIAHGQTVSVSGTQYQGWNPYTPYWVNADFSCENGTLTTNNPYDFEIYWSI